MEAGATASFKIYVHSDKSVQWPEDSAPVIDKLREYRAVSIITQLQCGDAGIAWGRIFWEGSIEKTVAESGFGPSEVAAMAPRAFLIGGAFDPRLPADPDDPHDKPVAATPYRNFLMGFEIDWLQKSKVPSFVESVLANHFETVQFSWHPHLASTESAPWFSVEFTCKRERFVMTSVIGLDPKARQPRMGLFVDRVEPAGLSRVIRKFTKSESQFAADNEKKHLALLEEFFVPAMLKAGGTPIDVRQNTAF